MDEKDCKNLENQKNLTHKKDINIKNSDPQIINENITNETNKKNDINQDKSVNVNSLNDESKIPTIILMTVRIEENKNFRPAEEILFKIIMKKLNLSFEIREFPFSHNKFIKDKGVNSFIGRLPCIYFNSLMIQYNSIPEFLLKLLYFNTFNESLKEINEKEKQEEIEKKNRTKLKKEENLNKEDDSLGFKASIENDKNDKKDKNVENLNVNEINDKKDKIDINDLKESKDNNTNIELAFNRKISENLLIPKELTSSCTYKINDLKYFLNIILYCCRDQLRYLNELSILKQINNQNKFRNEFLSNTSYKIRKYFQKFYNYVFSQSNNIEEILDNQKLTNIFYKFKEEDRKAILLKFDLSEKDIGNESNNNFCLNDEIIRIGILSVYEKILNILNSIKENSVENNFFKLVICSYLKEDEQIYINSKVSFKKDIGGTISTNIDSINKNEESNENRRCLENEKINDLLIKISNFPNEFEKDLKKIDLIQSAEKEFLNKNISAINSLNPLFYSNSICFDFKGKQIKKIDVREVATVSLMKFHLITIGLFCSLIGFAYFYDYQKRKKSRK